MITFSDTAKTKAGEIVKDAGDDCIGLRVRAHKLGRHTFRYQLHLVKKEDVEESDTVVDLGGFSAHVDQQSADWLSEATIDYVTVDGQSGFKVDNPTAEPKWDDPVSAKVQKVITEKLLPSLSSHGGWLELNRVEGDTAYVVLGGGCQGCSSARETLKFGVEAAIKEDVPEIAHVVDETDHTAGDAPYVSK